MDTSATIITKEAQPVASSAEQPADESPDIERTSVSLARELFYGACCGRKRSALRSYY